jgi:hypothetical protein
VLARVQTTSPTRAWLLHSAERGDTTNDFYEISEDAAMQIGERIRCDDDERRQ